MFLLKVIANSKNASDVEIRLIKAVEKTLLFSFLLMKLKNEVSIP